MAIHRLSTSSVNGCHISLETHPKNFKVEVKKLLQKLLRLRQECCTFTNGEYVKSGLAELELWCCQDKEEGFLDAQFSQLQQHQDESNATFVTEVVTLFFEDSERLLNDLNTALKISGFAPGLPIGTPL